VAGSLVAKKWRDYLRRDRSFNFWPQVTQSRPTEFNAETILRREENQVTWPLHNVPHHDLPERKMVSLSILETSSFTEFEKKTREVKYTYPICCSHRSMHDTRSWSTDLGGTAHTWCRGWENLATCRLGQRMLAPAVRPREVTTTTLLTNY
jgi:hypothetical protein